MNKPGTIANKDGDIWMYCPDSPDNSHTVVHRGVVALSKEQALEACKFGWRVSTLIYTGETDTIAVER